MANESLVKRLLTELEQVAPEHNADIVDVEVVGATKAPCVRVRIDHAREDAAPITLDEVSAHSSWVNEVIDEVDPFPGSYTVEVSSPGLGRPLRRARDFERFSGERVSLVLRAHEGRRRFTGELVGMRSGQVVLSCDDGEHAFNLDEIGRCTIKPQFDASGSPEGRK